MVNNPTPKQKTRKSMEAALKTLMTGSRDEYRCAKKELASLWRSDTKGFQENADIALAYIREFDSVAHDENKAAFVSGLSMFFLVLADDHFEELKMFVLKVIQSSNGQIRQAIIKVADWLYVSLTARIDSPLYSASQKKNVSDVREDEEEKKAMQQYIELVRDIERLIEKYDNNNETAVYIDDMKPSVNKSLQYLWSRLTDSPMYREVIEKTQPVSFELLMKRQEIVALLDEYLIRGNSEFTSDDVKNAIYSEEDSSDIQTILAMFNIEKHGAPDINTVLRTVNDAWNHFPHQRLNGLSPYEMLDQQS